MRVSMITELLSGMTSSCASCGERKLLEFLAVEDDGRMSNICGACKDRLVAELSLKKVEKGRLWVRPGAE
jgi:hypothetical protein